MNLPTGRTPHDPAQLAAAPAILDFTPTVSAPDRLYRPGIAFEPQMGDNAVDPDCTAESLRECATAAAAVLGGYKLNVARTASLAFYCRCKGLPANATPAAILASDGANMLDVAREQWAGAGFDTGYDTLRGQFGTVPIGDRNRLAAGAATFGLGWWGIRLYQRDMDTFYSADPWDDDGSDPGALVGLHAIGGAWEYTGLGDTDEAVTVTYGQFKPTKWRWFARRLEEAHGFRFRQLDRAGAAAIDEDGLTAALTRWAA